MLVATVETLEYELLCEQTESRQIDALQFVGETCSGLKGKPAQAPQYAQCSSAVSDSRLDDLYHICRCTP